jgi:predicted DNA-binding transcriptional regulator AlpA
MPQPDEILSASEVAEILGNSVITMYTMRHRGIGPAGWRRGNRLAYRRSDVDAFLAREREATLRGEGSPDA